MRASIIALLALICIVGCAEGGSPVAREGIAIHARFAPDARALRELEAQIAIDSFSYPPPVEQGGAMLEAPRSHLRPLGLRTRTPVRTETETSKPAEPSKPAETSKPPEDPYADWAPESAAPSKRKTALRRPPPLVPRATAPRRAPRKLPRPNLAQDIAIGIGGGALAVSALSISASLDGSSEGGYVVGGVALGIGFVALGAAVVIAVTEDDEDTQTSTVRPSTTGFGIDF